MHLTCRDALFNAVCRPSRHGAYQILHRRPHIRSRLGAAARSSAGLGPRAVAADSRTCARVSSDSSRYAIHVFNPQETHWYCLCRGRCHLISKSATDTALQFRTENVFNFAGTLHSGPLSENISKALQFDF